MFEALYDERAFRGATIKELHENSKVAHRREPPKGGVPKWLHALLQRGMRGKPAERFETMGTLLAELGKDRGRIRRLSLLALAVIAPVTISAGVVMSRSNAKQPELCTASAAQMKTVWNADRRNSYEVPETVKLPLTAEAVWESIWREPDWDHLFDPIPGVDFVAPPKKGNGKKGGSKQGEASGGGTAQGKGV